MIITITFLSLSISIVVVSVFFLLLLHIMRIKFYAKKITQAHVSSNGGEHVGKVMKSHGVESVFCLCGGHISPILVGLQKQGIQVVDVRDEASAVFAADAYARLTGKIGIAIVTAGPGVTNTITAVKNAQMAESPLILFGGAAPTLLKGRGSLQDVDQMSVLKSMCKEIASVKRVREIVPVLKRLFRVSQEGVPGPCFVEIPIDLLYTYSTVVSQAGIKKKFSIVQEIIKYRIDRNFYKAFESVDLKPMKIRKLWHPPGKVRRVANMLNKSKRPIMLLGSQVVKNIKLIEETVSTLNELNIPFFVSGKCRGITGVKNKLCFRNNRSSFARKADLILLFGISPDFRLSYGRSLNKKAKIVAVNLCPKTLKLNTDVFWKPNISVVSEPQQFLIDVGNIVKKKGFDLNRQSWIDEITQAEEKRVKQILEKSKEKGEKINPLQLCHEIDKHIDDNSIIIVDGGDFAATVSYIVKPRKALSWMDPGPFGTLGVGAGFALGAKYACPEKKIWLFYGDGAFGWSICEFDTFSRKQLKGIISVIGNDACWSQVARDQIKIFNNDIAMNLSYTKYDECVKGLGCEGILLENSNEIKNKIEEAKEKAKNGVVVLNTLIRKTNFRDGSISV